MTPPKELTDADRQPLWVTENGITREGTLDDRAEFEAIIAADQQRAEAALYTAMAFWGADAERLMRKPEPRLSLLARYQRWLQKPRTPAEVDELYWRALLAVLALNVVVIGGNMWWFYR